jgi:hypothetical protein
MQTISKTASTASLILSGTPVQVATIGLLNVVSIITG